MSYEAKLTRLNGGKPFLSSRNGGSMYTYNYNAAYVPPRHSGERGALLVRCQSRIGPSAYDVDPSVITYTPLQTSLEDIAHGGEVRVGHVSNFSIVIFPTPTNHDQFGTEDPRVAYDEATGTYLTLFSAVQRMPDGSALSRLALSRVGRHGDMGKAADYDYEGPLFPHAKWSKSGALLVREPTSYLFWGDSSLQPGLHVATCENVSAVPPRFAPHPPQVFLPTRATHFDSHLVEAGPPPMRLQDGNYLFVYNSARAGFPSKKPGYELQYNVGFAILSAHNLTHVIQRSSTPILSPELSWEKGDDGELSLTPNVVFVEGMARVAPNHDDFILFYGAADSVLGVALLSISQSA